MGLSESSDMLFTPGIPPFDLNHEVRAKNNK